MHIRGVFPIVRNMERGMFYNDYRIGVLGGGQLGRMLIQEAINLNLYVSVLDPDADAPCKYIANQFVQGSITDYDSVMEFGKNLDLITIEIENVNTKALEQLEKRGVKVFPQPHIIRLIQDKRTQKSFYKEKGIPTSDFVWIDHRDELQQHLHLLPGFLKLGKAGYDGRGVVALDSEKDFEKAFDAPSLLEKKVQFSKEVSVIVARNAQGHVSHFPVIELVFNPQYNLVDYLLAPANISKEQEQKAIGVALEVIEKLEMVGLLAVEMFITHDGEVLVNEIAPRPHNSGHHTIEGNFTSQYAQMLRAILGLPFGTTHTRAASAMVNLIGSEGHNGIARYDGLEKVLSLDGVYVHLYGKKFTKPSRKMGHITIIDADKDKLMEKINFVKKELKVVA